jgi:hypothetical protein
MLVTKAKEQKTHGELAQTQEIKSNISVRKASWKEATW